LSLKIQKAIIQLITFSNHTQPFNDNLKYFLATIRLSVKETVEDCIREAEVSIDKIIFSRLPISKPKNLLKYEKTQEIIKLTNNEIKKPQEQYTIDNSYNSFIPLIHKKYFTTYPIPEEIICLQKTITNRNISLKDVKNVIVNYPHPYTRELMELRHTIEELSIPIKDSEFNEKNIADTPFKYVTLISELKELEEELNNVPEFAVDLEHHFFRSYLGLTCLVQISTRKKDYVIDALTLRNHMSILQSPFANPRVVKVFHSSGQDIQWLQRDFGIYIVNMFDTAQAAKILEYQTYSLEKLLKEFCGKEVDKKYQLADWRTRPIPPAMLQYARNDTHYLLHIYDILRKKLINYGKAKTHQYSSTYLMMVFDRSKEICLRVYQKPILKNYEYYGMINNYKKSFTKIQMSIFKLILKLRDYIARVEDESLKYVCSNELLLEIARNLPVMQMH